MFKSCSRLKMYIIREHILDNQLQEGKMEKTNVSTRLYWSSSGQCTTQTCTGLYTHILATIRSRNVAIVVYKVTIDNWSVSGGSCSRGW